MPVLRSLTLIVATLVSVGLTGCADPNDPISIIESCSATLKHDQHNIKALEERSKAFLANGNVTLALADCQHLMRLEPGKPTWVRKAADIQVMLADPGAIDSYTRLLAMEPPTGETLLARAGSYATHKMFEQSYNDLQATKSLPLSPGEVLERANMYHSIGKELDSEESLKQVLVTPGGDNVAKVDALKQLSNRYSRLGKFDQALALYNKYIFELVYKDGAQKPGEPRFNQINYLLMQNQGNLYLVTGARDKAMESYQKALDMVAETNSFDVVTVGPFGNLLYDDLVAELNLAALLRDPVKQKKCESHVIERAEYLVHNGRTKWYNGRIMNLLKALSPEGRAAFAPTASMLFDIAPKDSIDVQFGRIELLVDLGKNDEARFALESLRDPLVFRPVNLYLELGDCQKALARADQISTSPVIMLAKGRAALACGDLALAKSCMDIVMQSDEPRGEAYLAMSDLAKAQKDIKATRRYRMIAAALGNQQALLEIRDKRIDGF